MRLGLIGLKGHQSTVLEGARKLNDCELVAVAEDDESALQSFLRREPLARNAQSYRDWRHLLEHSVIDVCCLCDESGKRAEQLIALAGRNMHIITEKPLTTTLADLERVREALAPDKTKSRLTMLLTMRYESKYATMRRVVREGGIGEVALATAQKSYRLGIRPEWQRSRERLGGTIPFVGIHAVDLIYWVTGLSFTKVTAFHGNVVRPELKETEDQASIILQLVNGGSATAHLDYLRPPTAPSHGDDRLRLAGSEGVLETLSDGSELLLTTTQNGPQRILLDPVGDLFVDYVNALRTSQPLPISQEDCFYVTDVVLRARESADTMKVMEIPSSTVA